MLQLMFPLVNRVMEVFVMILGKFFLDNLFFSVTLIGNQFRESSLRLLG